MDKVIVTGLLIIGSVTAAVLVIITITPSISGTSQSIIETSREASNRMKTDIEVIAVATSTDGTRLVLQRRITKYVVLPFVFGCQRAITVGSSHHVVRFKSFSKIALLEEPSL